MSVNVSWYIQYTLNVVRHLDFSAGSRWRRGEAQLQLIRLISSVRNRAVMRSVSGVGVVLRLRFRSDCRITPGCSAPRKQLTSTLEQRLPSLIQFSYLLQKIFLTSGSNKNLYLWPITVQDPLTCNAKSAFTGDYETCCLNITCFHFNSQLVRWLCPYNNLCPFCPLISSCFTFFALLSHDFPLFLFASSFILLILMSRALTLHFLAHDNNLMHFFGLLTPC